MEKYKVIAEYIMNEIEKNNIQEGNKMPSVRDLAQQFSCSKSTVIKSYEYLQSKKIIYSLARKGYYLMKKATSENYPKTPKTNKNHKIDFSSLYPDTDIIPFDDFHKCIDDALDIYKNELFNTCNPHGLPALIKTIIHNFQDKQIFAKPEDTFITNGSQQAISILSQMSFGDNKDTVLIEKPTYHGIIRTLSLNNTDYVTIERNKDGVDIKEMEEIFKTHKIKFFYTIPRLHNPTGYTYNAKTMKKILDLCKKYDVYIIEDDYLGDMIKTRNSYSMYSMDINDNVIYLKSFSKILMPGLRIAAVILPQKLSLEFMEQKKWNDLNTSLLTQGALEIYIKSGHYNEHIKKMQEIYFERMEKLRALASRINCHKLNWNIPQEGMFASFSLNDSLNLNSFKRNLYKENIIIRNTSENYPRNLYSYLFRVSIARTNFEDINRGIQVIIESIP